MVAFFIIFIVIFIGMWVAIIQRDNALTQLRLLQNEIPLIEANARNDAIKKSRSVIRGKVTEELVTLIPGFPYLGSDCKFFGMPFDYLVLDGMSEVRDGEIPEIRSLIFVDVKTGSASLSPVERAIKRCVERGDIRWETWKISEKGIDIQAK